MPASGQPGECIVKYRSQHPDPGPRMHLHSFHKSFPPAVILPDHDAQQCFLQETNDNGVMTRPIWELMNRLPMFEHCQHDSLENTIWFADRVVNIPSSVNNI